MPAYLEAAMVDFTYPFAGIDDDTSSWSTSDATVNLNKSSISILNGLGTITGYEWVSGLTATNLSQRGTRGLGIFDGELDEINKLEIMVVSFTAPSYLNSFEVRSLFINDAGWHGLEQGDLYGYLNGGSIFNQHLLGQEDFYVSGTKGIASYSYDDPYLIDTLIFTVLPEQSYSSGSDFALAKLDVTATPEPASMLLVGLGFAGLAAFKRKKGAIS